MALNGFSVLAWVKPDCAILWDVDDAARESIINDLLSDFCILIGCRWNMDMHQLTIRGTKYAFGVNSRITASERTITNAIGDLSNHVDFLRGTTSNSPEDLARFKECKEKWKVPTEVSSSSSGWDPPARPETLTKTKLRRL